MRKGDAIDVGLGHIGVAIGRLADVVDGCDVGVTELGDSAGAVDKAPGKGVVFRRAGSHNVQPHQSILIDVIGPVQVSMALLGEALFYLILIQQFFEQARDSHWYFRQCTRQFLGSNDSIARPAAQPGASLKGWLCHSKRVI